MKVLMLSTDARIFEPGSEVRERMRSYGRVFDELRVVVVGGTSHGAREEQIGENVFAYRASRNPFSWHGLAAPLLSQGGEWVITAQDPFEIGFGAWMLARRFRVPFQLQVHTDFLSPYFARESWKNRIRVRLAKFLLPRADRIRVVSERIKQSIISQFPNFPISRITILPIFVPTAVSLGSVHLHEKYPDFDRIILMASRITREKNIGLAMRAMQKIVKRFPKTLLLIVGDGPEKENLQLLITHYSLQNNVLFEPHQEDIASYYASADLLLLTSNYEGYGRTISEALMAGLPVIATDVGIAGEVINGKNGSVVGVGDLDGLVHALTGFLEKPPERNETVFHEVYSETEYLARFKGSFPALKKEKLCYVVPAWREGEATHFAYLKEFVREIAKRFDVYLIVERGDMPRDSGAVWVRTCDSRSALLRMLRIKFALFRARVYGCRTFYVHYSFFAAFTASVIARLTGGRVLYWNCGEPWKYSRPWFREQFERLTYRLIHAFVTGTPGLADQYAKHYGIPREKIQVMANWVQTGDTGSETEDRRQLRTKLSIPEKHKVVLFAHRLSRRKGAHHLPEIVRAFKGEPITFLIAGEGPEGEHIKSQITKYKLDANVRFLGPVPHPLLSDHYALSDLFLMPSDEEGFPHVLLEAMALKVPFVATDVGGVREMVPESYAEFIVPSGDVAAMAAACRKLLAMPSSEKQELSEMLFAWVRQYDLPLVAKRFEEIIAARPRHPLRLYFIANARMPNSKAHGIQLAKMCEAFVAQGIDLELILPRKQAEAAGEFNKFYNLRQPVRVKRLLVLDIARRTRFGFNLAAATFAFSSFLYLLAFRLRGKRGIIYTIDLDQFSFFLIPLLGMPYFFETHSSKRNTAAYRFFFRRASGMVAVNESATRTLAERFRIPDAKIRVLPNGVDLTRFNPEIATKREARERLKLPLNEQIVLYVGRFYSWKSLETFAATVERLRFEAQCYLVGGTEVEFRSAVKSEHIPKNILFAGSRDHAEIPIWIAAADVCLVLGTALNEYSFHETSPMKLFEYMAMERSVVASRTPAIAEIISEREAFLAEPDNSEALAAAIREALKNPAESVARAARAREKALEFSWEKRAERILQFIRERT